VAVKQILLPVVVGNMSELAPLTLHSMHTYAMTQVMTDPLQIS
jgi:hypothetical protein